MCLKHVEARNKLIVKQKICASSWFNYWDKYNEIHGQQNVKIPGKVYELHIHGLQNKQCDVSGM